MSKNHLNPLMYVHFPVKNKSGLWYFFCVSTRCTYIFCIKLWLGTYFSSILSLVLFWGGRTVLYTVQASSNSKYLLHTGLICSRSFQNYAFKGCLFLKTMKLWLLVLTKTLFLIVLIIKLTLGNIFMKVKNLPGGATVTKKIKTNLKTHVSPLLIHSQRS